MQRKLYRRLAARLGDVEHAVGAHGNAHEFERSGPAGAERAAHAEHQVGGRCGPYLLDVPAAVIVDPGSRKPAQGVELELRLARGRVAAVVAQLGVEPAMDGADDFRCMADVANLGAVVEHTISHVEIRGRRRLHLRQAGHVGAMNVRRLLEIPRGERLRNLLQVRADHRNLIRRVAAHTHTLDAAVVGLVEAVNRFVQLEGHHLSALGSHLLLAGSFLAFTGRLSGGIAVRPAESRKRQKQHGCDGQHQEQSAVVHEGVRAPRSLHDGASPLTGP